MKTEPFLNYTPNSLNYTRINCLNCYTQPDDVDGNLILTKNHHYVHDMTMKIDILQVALYFIVFIVGTTGNSLVYYYFSRKKRHRGKGSVIPEHLLSWLAMVDLLASVVIPAYHLHQIFIGSWGFGQALCKIVGPLAIILNTTSIGIFIIVAFDRAQTIVFNSLQYFTKASSNATLLLALLYNVVINSYLFKEFKVVSSSSDHPQQQRCEMQPYLYQISYYIPRILSFVLGNFVLFIVFLIINVFIVSRRRLNRGDIWKLGALWQKRKKDSLKILHMVNLMVAAYLVVVLPYDVLSVAFLASHLLGHPFKRTAHTDTLASYLKWLTAIKAFLNFPIYCYTHSGFRKFIRQLVC